MMLYFRRLYKKSILLCRRLLVLFKEFIEGFSARQQVDNLQKGSFVGM